MTWFPFSHNYPAQYSRVQRYAGLTHRQDPTSPGSSANYFDDSAGNNALVEQSLRRDLRCLAGSAR